MPLMMGLKCETLDSGAVQNRDADPCSEGSSAVRASVVLLGPGQEAANMVFVSTLKDNLRDPPLKVV